MTEQTEITEKTERKGQRLRFFRYFRLFRFSLSCPKVEYVVDQLSGAGAISYKKMFGEYGIYREDKMVAMVCDNRLFVKPTAGGRALLAPVTEAPPYPGAKPCFLIVVATGWTILDERKRLSPRVIIDRMLGAIRNPSSGKEK